MIVGILKEIKPEENRVAMTPAGAEIMKQNGHTVIVETSAGQGSGFPDQAYMDAAAEIVGSAAQVYKISDMVMHVKEPQPEEYEMIRKDEIGLLIDSYNRLISSLKIAISRRKK